MQTLRRSLAAAALLFLPMVATAITFPVTLDGDINGLPFTAVFEQNGDVTALGLAGSWRYDTVNQRLIVDIPGLLTARGDRQGRCFRGRVRSTALGNVPWQGCITP
jgi:hypothetical protein